MNISARTGLDPVSSTWGLGVPNEGQCPSPKPLQAKLRTMQNNWWTRLAGRTQRYADIPSHQIQAPLLSSDGSTLLTDKEAILLRWSEHFEGLFRDRRTVQESSLAKIPQVDMRLELDDPPTLKGSGKPQCS